MRTYCLIAIAATLCSAWTCPTAQDQPRQSEFPYLFPNPTGLNGYEDLVIAAEMCRDCPRVQSYWSADSENTLSEKRAVLAEPAVRRALELLRRGLATPLQPIHPQIDSDTRFPEFALFRLLARMLLLEENVLLADGRVSDAIDTFRDTLRLGAVCGGDLIIAGLVRIAIDAIGLRVIGDHLGQLSARDCDKLLVVAREWMAEPDPTAAMFEGEKRSIAATWDKAKTNPDGVFELLAPGDDQDEDSAENLRRAAYRQQVERVVTNPGAYASLIETVKSRSMARIDAEIAALRAPAWERVPVSSGPPRSLVDYLTDALVPVLDRFADRFVSESATARLLGLHAAIRRYLWEYDRLPERLEELHARDLLIDPYSGKPMVYKRTGERTYELTSAGPFGRDSEGKPTSSRVPLTLPRSRQ